MAIKLNKELDNGLVVDYFKIVGLNKHSRLDNNMEVLVELYASEAHRFSGKVPVATMVKIIPAINSFEEAYAELKKLEEFNGAEDC